MSSELSAGCTSRTARGRTGLSQKTKDERDSAGWTARFRLSMRILLAPCCGTLRLPHQISLTCQLESRLSILPDATGMCRLRDTAAR